MDNIPYEYSYLFRDSNFQMFVPEAYSSFSPFAFVPILSLAHATPDSQLQPISDASVRTVRRHHTSTSLFTCSARMTYMHLDLACVQQFIAVSPKTRTKVVMPWSGYPDDPRRDRTRATPLATTPPVVNGCKRMVCLGED
jgi:hypothetical protein